MDEKRKRKTKPRIKKERRADMQIISSANMLDIYIWTASVSFMLALIVFFVTIVFL